MKTNAPIFVVVQDSLARKVLVRLEEVKPGMIISVTKEELESFLKDCFMIPLMATYGEDT